MTDNLRRRATIRKATYFGLILALFTVSMFWRGVIALPFGNAAHAGEDRRFGDGLARLPILKQADALELRELDSGDPEVAGSAARHSMIGVQGVVITLLWYQAIEKQKRGEYHEFELLINVVTELQPNFIQPWLFQSWNIAYNVSVENDKLGDMYFYIARGIDLLAKGDRRNTKVYRGGGEDWKVGNPHIRGTIGLYYQNKFSVSDKVDVLRSLMQMSAMKPSDRDPDLLAPDGRVDDRKFREFCEANPQFVRRLQSKLNRKSPAAVVDFLRVNRDVPSRYDVDSKNADRRDRLVADEAQFPIFPPPFASKRREYTGRDETNDSFDAFLAARAWYEYGVSVVPPPVEGVPASAPRPGEYDAFKYRIPTQPMLILYRMQPSRSQTYLAEYLQKEGWFDETTRWNPDEQADSPNAWFARDGKPALNIPTRGSPLGGGSGAARPVSAMSEYAEAHAMWVDFGRTNGLILTNTQMQRYRDDAVRTVKQLGPLGGLPPDFTDDQLESLGLEREWVKARAALVLHSQNASTSNFPFFLASTEAEASRELVEARKLRWEADRAYASAETTVAIRRYTEANAKWRLALQRYPTFHRGERMETVEDSTAELEVKLMKLLVDERRGAATKSALGAIVPQSAIAPGGPGFERELAWGIADAETTDRIALEILKTLDPAAGPESIRAGGKYAYLRDSTYPTNDVRSQRWLNPAVRDAARAKEGLLRKPPTPPMPAGGPPLPGGPAR